ncbi:hypothetical protein DL93DRAFT_1170495 [Clavulina sp. PMI_390]|nr:hypothetical protein DL93DRAFT_1170495 [Clavulina sp. PMI_390]
MNARVLRDIRSRKMVEQFEVKRRAYLAVARNQTLPAAVRYQAQLQLNNFDKATRPAIVNDRCTETGRGRGVIAKMGLCRYRFRLKALAGELPGVRKATW